MIASRRDLIASLRYSSTVKACVCVKRDHWVTGHLMCRDMIPSLNDHYLQSTRWKGMRCGTSTHVHGGGGGIDAQSRPARGGVNLRLVRGQDDSLATRGQDFSLVGVGGLRW